MINLTLELIELLCMFQMMKLLVLIVLKLNIFQKKLKDLLETKTFGQKYFEITNLSLNFTNLFSPNNFKTMMI